uniref:Uncharacterized protein n=1 Tax=Anguilla anguilla TaxID=7936 RepID=A0A0E9RSG8_ANGAN
MLPHHGRDDRGEARGAGARRQALEQEAIEKCHAGLPSWLVHLAF